MAKEYSNQERAEALRLADEIGPRPAADRLAIPINTIYGWQSRARKRSDFVNAVVSEKGPEALVEENTRLNKELAKKSAEVEILQEALGFFVERRKK
jgi:transposase